MTCPCPVFKYEAEGVRITYHPGRQQPYAAWTRNGVGDFLINRFYATLKAAVAWL